jgi:hypothetical protein
LRNKMALLLAFWKTDVRLIYNNNQKQKPVIPLVTLRIYRLQ